MKKITIHEITLSVSFDSINVQEAAEMAASLVRDCEWAAQRINESRNPQPAPPDPIHDPHDEDWFGDQTVHYDEPF